MSALADVQMELENAFFHNTRCIEDWDLDYDGDVNSLPEVLTVKIKLKKEYR